MHFYLDVYWTLWPIVTTSWLLLRTRGQVVSGYLENQMATKTQYFNQADRERRLNKLLYESCLLSAYI